VHGFIQALIDGEWSFNVICNTLKSGIDKTNIIECNKESDYNSKLTKLALILFNKDLGSISFEREAIKKGNSIIKDGAPDVIISFVTGGSFQPLSIGAQLAKRFDIPYMIHTVDPLPSVPGWGEKPIYRRAVIRTIRPFFDQAAFLSANNEAILNYQVDLMKFKGQSFWLPTVIERKTSSKATNQTSVFLYAGSFYGKRNPKMLITGFKEFLKSQPNAALWIYGNNTIDLNEYELAQSEKDQILIRGFTTDIDAIINEATVLIDIDADVENDVFISGKLVHYLNTAKVVMAITPLNSPARMWLYEVRDTVSVANYSTSEISSAFANALELSKELSSDTIYERRNPFMSKFSEASVLNRLVKGLLSKDEN
jgi:glycosyltransferase involved in cell wall biosynthesis